MQEGFEKSFKMMFDPSVIKPFGILIIVTLGGIILCGFPITTYYFVPLLLESKIPIIFNFA